MERPDHAPKEEATSLTMGSVGVDFDLPGQFVLCDQVHPPWAGWLSYPCGELFFHAHKLLPVRRLVDTGGEAVGLAAGWLITQEGSLTLEDLTLPPGVSFDDTERLEDWIYGFGGRFIFIVAGKGPARLYVDAGATLGTVFSPAQRRVGSTVTALLWDQPGHPLWSRGLGVFPDDRPNQYYPAGITVDPGMHRLLPNHYLDLRTWQAVRHYPVHAPHPIRPKDTPLVADEIAHLVRRQVSAIVAAAPRTYVPLTGGRDSRTLLACSVGLHDRMEYVTFDCGRTGAPTGSSVDLTLSKEIARVLGLKHNVLRVPKQVPPTISLEYLCRIGFAGGSGKARDFYFSCQDHLDLSAAWIPGFGGEAWRASYWRDQDHRASAAAPEQLLDRLGLPVTDFFCAAMREWLEGLPADLPLTTVLELVYIEHRLGCWASPHLYGAAPFQMNLAPLCHRRIFELVLSLPLAYKQERLNRTIVSTRLPVLDNIPFNRYPGFGGLRHSAVQRIRRALKQRRH